MFESDADRLAMIKSLGGVLASTNAGTLWGVFDRNYHAAQFSGIEIEDRTPVFECRTSDVARLQLAKDTVLSMEAVEYRIKRFEPDGTGMTLVVLRS